MPQQPLRSGPFYVHWPLEKCVVCWAAAMSCVMNPGGDDPSGLAADPQPPPTLIETLAAADEAVAEHYAKVDAMGIDLEGDLGASGKLSLLQVGARDATRAVCGSWLETLA